MRPSPGNVFLAERALCLHRDEREDTVELELLEGEGAHSQLLDVGGQCAIPFLRFVRSRLSVGCASRVVEGRTIHELPSSATDQFL
jgi:hypothetical protein